MGKSSREANEPHSGEVVEPGPSWRHPDLREEGREDLSVHIIGGRGVGEMKDKLDPVFWCLRKEDMLDQGYEAM